MSRLAFALLASLTAASFASAESLYGIDDTSLYTVDPTTGAATLVANLNPPVEGLLGGLDWAGGLLYGLAGTPGNALWTVDPTNGVTRMVGLLNVGAIFEGGLAWDGEALWGVNQGLGNGPKYLVRIDRATGAGTIIGQIGADGVKDINGMAVAGGELYGIDRVTNALWRIDRVNPRASNQVGWAFGGAIDLGVKGGMAGEYAYADDTRNFFSVNFDNGAVQELAHTAVAFRSLAPLSEPAGLGDGGAGAQRLLIVAIEPNPTPGPVRVRLQAPARGPVSLEIYDPAGRMVRTVLHGANPGVLPTWDGCDNEGALVKPGVYFVRVRSEGHIAHGKVVMAR